MLYTYKIRSAHNMPLETRRENGSIEPTHLQPGITRSLMIEATQRTFTPPPPQEVVQTRILQEAEWAAESVGAYTEKSSSLGFDPRTFCP